MRLFRLFDRKLNTWVWAGLGLALGWSCLARFAPDRPSRPAILFALAPASPEFSPDVDWQYPPTTRLLKWQKDERESSTAELLPGWTLASPPVVAFDGQRVLFAGKRQESDWVQIWETDLAGSTPRLIIDWRGDCLSPHYLPDGRIVFSAPGAAQTGQPGRPFYSLFTCAPDGSRWERITFGRGPVRVVEVLQDGRILFERHSPGTPNHALCLQMTVHPDGTGVARYFSSPSAGLSGSGPQIVARPEDGDGEYALYRTSTPGGRELLFKREGFHALDPVPLQAHPSPAVSTSVVDSNKTTGWLLCLDASWADLPNSPERGPQKPRKVRVLEGEAGPVLGEASIYEDGSFFLRVPADRLLRLETVDQGGKVISRLQSGIWVRPNEHRGCVGCHEPLYLAPENRVPLALQFPPVPIATSRSGRGRERVDPTQSP